MLNLFDTPIFRGIPRYFPNIGSPEEMSPINDVTHDYENQTPPVIEVSPKNKDNDNQLK